MGSWSFRVSLDDLVLVDLIGLEPRDIAMLLPSLISSRLPRACGRRKNASGTAVGASVGEDEIGMA